MLPVSLFPRQTLAGGKGKKLFGLFRKYLPQKASSLHCFERPTEPQCPARGLGCTLEINKPNSAQGYANIPQAKFRRKTPDLFSELSSCRSRSPQLPMAVITGEYKNPHQRQMTARSVLPGMRKLWRCLGNRLSFCGNPTNHNFPWNPGKSHDSWTTSILSDFQCLHLRSRKLSL